MLLKSWGKMVEIWKRESSLGDHLSYLYLTLSLSLSFSIIILPFDSQHRRTRTSYVREQPFYVSAPGPCAFTRFNFPRAAFPLHPVLGQPPFPAAIMAKDKSFRSTAIIVDVGASTLPISSSSTGTSGRR